MIFRKFVQEGFVVVGKVERRERHFLDLRALLQVLRVIPQVQQTVHVFDYVKNGLLARLPVREQSWRRRRSPVVSLKFGQICNRRRDAFGQRLQWQILLVPARLGILHGRRMLPHGHVGSSSFFSIKHTCSNDIITSVDDDVLQK